jgi:[protein-PII] uridylyltransferase
MLALYALPYEAHKDLWETLDVGYFMRHDATDIAWHTRQLSRQLMVAKSKAESMGVAVARKTISCRRRFASYGLRTRPGGFICTYLRLL